MQGHKFVVWDTEAFEAMKPFPLQQFDTPPVAFLRIGDANDDHFFVALEANGKASSLSPSVFQIHCVLNLVDDDIQEETILAGIAFHHKELCLVLWDATIGSYTAHFLKTCRTALTHIGKALLNAPDPSLVLCGLSHLGNALFVVWSDGSMQHYKPIEGGLNLVRTYHLSGIDFLLMKSKEKTEDLRKLPYGVSVCLKLDTFGYICVVGPQTETANLKYVVLDVESGRLRDSGIVEGKKVEGPIKIAKIPSKQSAFQLFVEREDRGTIQIEMERLTLATRIGSKALNRKRKLEETMVKENDAENEIEDVLLVKPYWNKILSSGKAKSLKGEDSAKLIKKIRKRKRKTNGKVQPFDGLGQRISKLKSNISEAKENNAMDRTLISDAFETLKELKQSGNNVLLDLSGIVADYVGCHCQEWNVFRDILLMNPPRSLLFCPELPEALWNSCQYDIFSQMLSKLKEIQTDELLRLLEMTLSEKDPERLIHQANALDRIHFNLETSLSCAQREESSMDILKSMRWKVYAVSGFDFNEILLHGIVAIPMISNLGSVLYRLNSKHIKKLLTYLEKWFCIVESEFCSNEEIQFQDLECIYRLPLLNQTTEWITTLLSVHSNVLLRDASMHEVHLGR